VRGVEESVAIGQPARGRQAELDLIRDWRHRFQLSTAAAPLESVCAANMP